MIAIVDYGVGNLRSVEKAFEYLGFDARVTDDPRVINDASHIVLPGVGAAADAMRRLGECGLDAEMIRQAKSGKPFLGICLGMQLLLDVSYENGAYACLGLIPGRVERFAFEDPALKIPHMGWNAITPHGLPGADGARPYMYFVHSYHAADVPREHIAAVCRYGYDFTCAVRRGNLYGLQFHPEKSGDAGLSILKEFGGMK
jgi:glutamine amidotransferase